MFELGLDFRVKVEVRVGVKVISGLELKLEVRV